MTNTLTDLRIASAKAVGKEVFTPPGHWPDHAKGDVVIRRPDRSLHVWAPDLEGREAQLVELIECLMKQGRCEDIYLAMKRRLVENWKLAIMRAVAEVTDDK